MCIRDRIWVLICCLISRRIGKPRRVLIQGRWRRQRLSRPAIHFCEQLFNGLRVLLLGLFAKVVKRAATVGSGAGASQETSLLIQLFPQLPSHRAFERIGLGDSRLGGNCDRADSGLNRLPSRQRLRLRLGRRKIQRRTRRGRSLFASARTCLRVTPGNVSQKDERHGANQVKRPAEGPRPRCHQVLDSQLGRLSNLDCKKTTLRINLSTPKTLRVERVIRPWQRCSS